MAVTFTQLIIWIIIAAIIGFLGEVVLHFSDRGFFPLSHHR